MKAPSEIIKEIRKLKNLTQKQFAKKFFITEKTVSNYENGVRTPSIDFLTKVCEEFNLTLDYFSGKAKFESNPNDLVVSEKNGKYALFDKKQSIFLTQHLYDCIMISESGNHIVYNTKETKRNGVICKVITYSAIVDNFGLIKEFPHLEFGFNGSFGLYNVCPAYNKKTKKIHLVNNNGEVLSKGYARIRNANVETGINWGLFFGITFKHTNEEIEIEAKDLLYINGNKIEATLEDVNDNLNPKVVEYKNINIVLDHLKKYGAGVLSLCPNEIFKVSENYPQIIITTIENAKKDKYYKTMLSYTIDLLNEYAEALKPLAKTKANKELIYPKDLYIKNQIEKNLLNRSLDVLYDKLRLI